MQTITSRKNPRITHMKKLGASREYRQTQGEFLCDGFKLLQEAVKNGARIRTVLYCGEPETDLPESAEILPVSRDVIEYVSPMKNPQNILFSCAVEPAAGSLPAAGRFLVLDGIQDPGNVGTILRGADAFGMDGVILTGDCADLYNPKTVRATMGAVFRQKTAVMDLTALAAMKRGGIRFYGAALHRDSKDVRQIGRNNCAVVIGSEGRGISPEVLALCDETVVIPMLPRCESLNAAAAASVIMWELVRETLPGEGTQWQS